MNSIHNAIENLIYNAFDNLESNNFKVLNKPDNPMYEKPLIGIASGDDPYFNFLVKALKCQKTRILKAMQIL